MTMIRKTIIPIILLLFLASSCVEEEYPADDSNQSAFETLWRLIDEHYCFFPYKAKTIGLDWNEVHARYAPLINENMDAVQLFEVCCNMLSELRDGHVNLSAGYDVGRYWNFWQDYPENFNDSIVRCYLGTDYHIASGLDYTILPDNTGYVRCESFSTPIGNGNISDMLFMLATTNGIIIDVRGNGGGDMTNSDRLASHFITKRRLTGYIYHKTGKGHDDFSEPFPVYLDPATGRRWFKPTVVLTNRQCYSATNDFVKNLKGLDHITILGDTTGGGAGMPMSQEISNGWGVRYSAVVFEDANHQQTEFGIAPDTVVTLTQSDLLKKKDTLIEAACELIRKKTK